MNERQRVDDMDTLVLEAQSGDARAFRELVERSYGQIYRWALAHTGDPDDADDVAQNVLVRLSTRIARFRGDSRFSTWLYRLTRNMAVDHHRRRERQERAEQRAAAEPGADVVPSAAGWVDTRDAVGTVLTAYRRLPDRQRAVFDLVDLQGYAPTEAAELLDMKPVTARAHLHKARRAVRRAALAMQPDLAEEYDV